MKVITENQLHDFLINSRHSCKKYCLHNSTIMRNYNHRTSSDKIWAQEGRLFRQKVVIFPSFSSVIMNFFLTNQTSFVYWSSSPKTSKSLMLEVAKVLKLTLFSIRSLKSLTPAFSQIFLVTPIFFKILTTGTKGSIIPRSEGVLM